MSSSKCARCDKTVYPVEGLRCLDKLWHKGCFKCNECNMTLNMKNYKGFEKRPYCNAHCPQAKATTVADTPESRRLAENTRIQSQAKYHEDFEKSKGKNFTTIADDPETRRIKETSKIISNASYHGDLERKKQMEEKRSISGPEELPISRLSISDSVAINNNNNSNIKHRMQSNNNNSQNFDHQDLTAAHQAQQQQQQHQQQQRLVQQQQQYIQMQQQQQQQQQAQQQQAQQLLLKQQQQYVQPMINRKSSGLIENQQQLATRNVHQQQPFLMNHTQQQQQQQQQIQLQLHQQQQQQQLMRRQQQQQQQIIMQQHRQSMDPSIQINRQISKQAIVDNNNHPLMKHPNIVSVQQQQQQPIKYMPINDAINGQSMPHHLVGMPPHALNQMSGSIQPQGNRRLGPNSQQGGPPQQATQHNPMMHGYNSHPVGSINGVMPKHSAPMGNMQPAPHLIQHQDQMLQQQQHQQQQQQINHRLQMRPATNAGQPMQAMPQQVPRRVFRAMYDYVANDVDEVSFLENDILVDCVNVDRNWLIGKVARSGQTGMLPANYVEMLPSQ